MKLVCPHAYYPETLKGPVLLWGQFYPRSDPDIIHSHAQHHSMHYVGNVRIGFWANLPQYKDRNLCPFHNIFRLSYSALDFLNLFMAARIYEKLALHMNIHI